MATILDLPDFMFQNKLVPKSKFKKIYLTIFGLFVGFIHKSTKDKMFCSIMNLFFPNDGKIFFENEKYSKRLWNGIKFSYPNKRIDRIIVDSKKHFENLYKTYCLDDITFNEDDLIIDCGANVGELYVSLKIHNNNFKYVGFEPDPHSFVALKENLKIFKTELYDLALSDSEGVTNLYLNTEGADSSLIYFGSKNKIEVQTRAIDSYKFNKIKLFKIEAEGGEFEVLKGSIKTLKNIQYLAIDYGPEKGVDNEPTSVEIINFLYTHNFRLLSVSKFRQVGLFVNTSIN